VPSKAIVVRPTQAEDLEKRRQLRNRGQ
jgi:hypothetical protein